LWRLICLVGALAVILISVSLAPALVAWLGSSVADFSARFVVRCVWSLALLLPWCVLAATFDRVRESRGSVTAPLLRFVLLVAVASSVPWIFADHLARQQAELAGELLASGKYAEAHAPVLALCDVGSSREINGQSPTVVARELATRTAAYFASLERPLSKSASDGERVARAQAHARFGQLKAARAELVAIVEHDVEACLLVAATYQEEGNFTESNRFYLHARSLAGEKDERAAIRAIDGLAFNARAVSRHDDAANLYRAGLAEFPVAAAHFHFQLGQHYQLGGRPWLAAEHFEQAAALEPKPYRAAADRQLAKLRLTTPACLPMTWRLGGSR
jgi:tetratricopeptide (TPR) repeat protein